MKTIRLRNQFQTGNEKARAPSLFWPLCVYIVVRYRRRMQRDKLVEEIQDLPFESEYGSFRLKVFRSKIDQREHYAIVAGDIGPEPTLIRVHAENLFVDLFRMKGEHGGDYLSGALRRIADEGKGAVVLISRPDKGLSRIDGGVSKTADMGLRDYGIGAQILVALGLKKIRLLSNTSRNVVGLDGYRLEIVSQEQV